MARPQVVSTLPRSSGFILREQWEERSGVGTTGSTGEEFSLTGPREIETGYGRLQQREFSGPI